MNTSCYHVLKANTTSFVILYENTAWNNVIQADYGDPRDSSIFSTVFSLFYFSLFSLKCFYNYQIYKPMLEY